jgi:hypothetical protein
MRILRILFVLLVLLLSVREARIATTASNISPDVAPSERGTVVLLDAPACATYFPKDKYVTTEREPLIIAIAADCPPGSPTDPKFEFLQPAPPSFVVFSQVYRGVNSALTLLFINPQRGDAGDYRINYRVGACSGGTGCSPLVSFRLKVKPAQ